MSLTPRSKVHILNIWVDSVPSSVLLEDLKDGGIVFTPNMDHLSKLQRDRLFYQAYTEANYCICDSQILLLASKMLSSPISEKISGSDLLPSFCRFYASSSDMTLFLLGSDDGVAERAGDIINQMVGREMVVGTYSPSFGFESDPAECQYIIDIINASRANVLAVGLGAPKQEVWIHTFKRRLAHVKVFLAVGAAIDFVAGHRQRSPRWMSDFGIEWLYRLFSEPKRLWRRYLVDDVPVIFLLLLQKLGLYSNPFQSELPYISFEDLTLQAGLLTWEQVNLVRRIQLSNKHLSFEDIITEYGWLSKETVSFFTDVFPSILMDDRRKRLPIGYYLRAANLLTDEQINDVLREQNKRSNPLFGQIASEKNWIRQETADLIVRYLDQYFPTPLSHTSYTTKDRDLDFSTFSRTNVSEQPLVEIATLSSEDQ